MKGTAIWFGPELASAMAAVAGRTGETPKQVAHRILGKHFKLTPPNRGPGQYASNAKRTGRPKKARK